MSFPVDLSDILPLKNGEEKRRNFSFTAAPLEFVISRNKTGVYRLWVYDKDPKGNNRKRFGDDKIANDVAAQLIWRAFLDEYKEIL